MVATAGNEVTRAWKPDLPGLREVFHARFTSHAYPAHVHDVWTVFLVDDGAIRYGLDGREHRADPARLGVLPPHVVHDGRPAGPAGFRKRVLYLETSLLGEHLVGAAVDRPDLADPALRGAAARLHDALLRPDDRLDAEIRLADLAERIGQALGDPLPRPSDQRRADLAGHLRAWLDDRVFEPGTIRDAAAAIGAGPTALARALSAEYGIAPHAYVIGRRLEAARDRILRGQALADVAADVGFHDQAHLSRRFAAFLGTTPGRYRAAVAPATHRE